MTNPVHNDPLILLLRTLNSELAASNRVVAARLGLNESDLAVLDLLHREGPQTPTVIARRTRMGATTMTGILRRLTRDGWVERRVNDADLRSFTIQVASVDRLAGIFRSANESFLSLLPADQASDRETVIAFLTDAIAVIRKGTQQLADEQPGSHDPARGA